VTLLVLASFWTQIETKEFKVPLPLEVVKVVLLRRR
jgi:hypothetical protein